MADELPTKVVGWGPFPMPWEKKRLRKAEEQARRMFQLAKEADQRTNHTDSEENDHG